MTLTGIVNKTGILLEWSLIPAPIYVLLEGLALGGISAVLELRYPESQCRGSA